LFDTTKPNQAGSTIPVRIQLQDEHNANVGSAGTQLTVRAVSQLPSGSSVDASASGNANPGSAFRFDGGAYIYNLSTRGLAPGSYVLSFFVGNERGYLYTVPFTLK
jgi:hypothetical protein